VLAEETRMRGYSLYASPTLYSGQTVLARLAAGAGNQGAVRAGLYVRCYDGDDQTQTIPGTVMELAPGQVGELRWTVPDLEGKPVYSVGLELSPAGKEAAPGGEVFLDRLGWQGAPRAIFRRLPGAGDMWKAAWVNGMEQWERGEAFNLVQNYGRGMVSTGGEWSDYQVSVPLRMAMGRAGGLAARVQGARRFYALLLCEDHKLRLVKALEGGDRVLGEVDFPWELWSEHQLDLAVCGGQLTARVDGQDYFSVRDDDRPLRSGGVGLVCEEGHILTSQVAVSPLDEPSGEAA